MECAAFEKTHHKWSQRSPWVIYLHKLDVNIFLVRGWKMHVVIFILFSFSAISVENELGQVSLLSATNEIQRRGIANRLLATDKISGGEFKGFKTVNRHLLNGDYLLLNRQPSLHRPSIMAHRYAVITQVTNDGLMLN